MRQAGAFVILLIFASGAAQAQTLQIQRIEILKKGIYDNKDIRRMATQDSPTGKTVVVGDIKNIENTTKVPAVLGLEFGIEYRVTGSPNNAKAPIKFVTVFPKPGLRPPSTGEVFLLSESVENVGVGTTGYKGYLFEKEWELVPGVWTIEVWHQNRKMAAQKFTVSKPKPSR